MAKPNDIRITPVPANAALSTTSGSTQSNTPGSTIVPIPATSNLTQILEALLVRQAACAAAPKPPKHARPPRIKPRRRVKVTRNPNPDADANLPWIRLCGHWLETAGFAMHKRARVHVGQGFMILIAEDES